MKKIKIIIIVALLAINSLFLVNNITADVDIPYIEVGTFGHYIEVDEEMVPVCPGDPENHCYERINL